MNADGASSLLQLTMNTTDPCSTCKKEVMESEQALFCDLCEWWEHLDCIRASDKPSQQCYNALTESRCTSIVFTCSRCRRKGTLARRLFQSEVTLESARSQLKSCERLLQERQQHLNLMCTDRDTLQLEIRELRAQLESARGACSERDALQVENKWLAAQLKDAWSETEKLHSDLLKVREWSNVTPFTTARTMESVLLTPSFLGPTVSSELRSVEHSGDSASRRKLPSIPPPVASSVSTTTSTTDTQLGPGSSSSVESVPPAPVTSSSSVATVLPPVIAKSCLATGPSTVTRTSRSNFVTNTIPPVVENRVIVDTMKPVSTGNVQLSESLIFKQPPGFKELRERVSKFSGDGKEDFEVWLADYCEATGDCGWTDQLRARWFSWFLVGAAKLTWQRTLSGEDKATWASIIQCYALRQEKDDVW